MTTGTRRRCVRRRLRSAAVCLALAAGATACSPTASADHQSSKSAAKLDPPGSGATVPVSLMMFHWLTWQQWHGTRLPSADRWGPTRIQSDAATGFSHTPEGALVAMMQQQARLAGIGDASWTAAAKLMAVVAPGDEPPTRRLPTGFDSTGDLPYFAGYRWVSYIGNRAVADLALQYNDGTLKTVHATEFWNGSDWKTELPATGETASPLGGLDEYQPWPSVPR